MRPSRVTERLRVTYRVTCGGGEDPVAKAQDIAYEQTVELPPGCVSPDVVARVVGRVEAVEPAGDASWTAVVSFDRGLASDDLGQLLNLLFGNVSMKAGVLLAEIAW